MRQAVLMINQDASTLAKDALPLYHLIDKAFCGGSRIVPELSMWGAAHRCTWAAPAPHDDTDAYREVTHP